MSPELRSGYEHRILNGESIAVVAADTPFSESAAKRHIRNHTNAQQQVAMRTLDASSLHVHEFGSRYLALADEASTLRVSTSDPRIKLLAIHEEAAILTSMITRLGIESNETVEALREARVLAMSLSSVLADQPGIASVLSRELAAAGEPDLSRAFLRLANDGSARHVAQAAGRPLREVGA